MSALQGLLTGITVHTDLSESELLNRIKLLSQLCEYANTLLSVLINDSGPPSDALLGATCHLVAVTNELLGQLTLCLMDQ